MKKRLRRRVNQSSDPADLLNAATRRVNQLWIANTILLAWLVILSLAVIELRYGERALPSQTPESNRIDQRIDDTTQCLWKLEARVNKLDGGDATGTGNAPADQLPACPPLATAPGPRE